MRTGSGPASPGCSAIWWCHNQPVVPLVVGMQGLETVTAYADGRLPLLLEATDCDPAVHIPEGTSGSVVAGCRDMEPDDDALAGGTLDIACSEPADCVRNIIKHASAVTEAGRVRISGPALCMQVRPPDHRRGLCPPIRHVGANLAVRQKHDSVQAVPQSGYALARPAGPPGCVAGQCWQSATTTCLQVVLTRPCPGTPFGMLSPAQGIAGHGHTDRTCSPSSTDPGHA